MKLYEALQGLAGPQKASEGLKKAVYPIIREDEADEEATSRQKKTESVSLLHTDQSDETTLRSESKASTYTHG